MSMRKRLAALMMALIVALAMVPTPAYAAKTLTVSRSAAKTSSLSQIKRVYKGSTWVNFKKGTGYVCFKPTTTKVHTIYFSNPTSAYKGKKNRVICTPGR